MRNSRGRGNRQYPRSTDRFAGRRGYPNCWLDALRFGGEERLGRRLAHARALLAIVAAIDVVW
jgi:hypothetical protein